MGLDIGGAIKGGIGGFLGSGGNPLMAGLGALGGGFGDTGGGMGPGPQFNPLTAEAIERQLDRTADTTVASFEGDRVADFTPMQLKALQDAGITAEQLGGFAGTAGRGFETIAGGERIGQNPFLDQALAATREQSLRDLTRNQLPTIRNTAVAGGGIGGSRQGIAEGLALSDMNRDLIAADVQARANQVNLDQANQLQALINQGNILSGQTAPLDLLMRSGGVEQAQNQAEIGAERERFNEQNIDQFNRDKELLQILLQGSPSSVPQMMPETDPFAMGTGLGLTAASIFGGPSGTSNPVANNVMNPASTNPLFMFGPS